MCAPKLPDRCFVDTNIWLYALVMGQDTLKHTRAQEIVQRTGIVISTQVINETCVNLLKKAGLTETQIQQLITAFYIKYEVIATEQAVLLRASQLREQYSLSYWDGLVVASALEAGCTVLYSEDMQAELVIMGQLSIVNPFCSAS